MPNYGQDSPAMVAGIAVAGVIVCGLALGLATIHAALALIVVLAVLGVYFLVYAGSIVVYSRRGKLRFRERILDSIPWRVTRPCSTSAAGGGSCWSARRGGRVALCDFVFTDECMGVLRPCGLADAARFPIGPLPVLTFGLLRPHVVTATKP